MGQQRDADDPDRPCGVGFAMARTWQTAAGKALKDLGRHLPRKYDHRPWVPRIPAANGRTIFWIDSQRVCLRPSGDVPVGLRKTGRNVGPQPTKILGTNLTGVTPRDVALAYQKRWAVEQMQRELPSDLGRGEPQGRGAEARMEHSFGSAGLAYLLLVRLCHHEMVPGRSWRVSQLQHALRLRVIITQVEHNVQMRLTKLRQAA